ncbi:GPW/gp25 family protein [Acinetobacter junii]|uniref:GPW/gp25 family protein n=1 Tax=Acinetobacter junii TaxID=40215 RepID=UPI0032121552
MMSRLQGKTLNNELDHIRQSIQDILTTPIGTRLMLREYGSLLSQLIDAPINETTQLQIKAATANAILQWEPRVMPNSISLYESEGGRHVLDLDLTMTSNNQNQSLKIPLDLGATL